MQLHISKEQNGITVLQLLKKELGFSTKLIKHLKFKEDGITVNGMRVTVRRILCEGDRVSLAFEDTDSAEIEPVDLPIEILYEDSELVVPAKSAYMPTHPSHDHHYDTVANALAFRYANEKIPFVFRPINRLDRNTSGLLLIARNRVAAGRLSESMRNGEIQKSYLAILDGELKPSEGRIEACLHRTAESIIVREVCAPDAPDADWALTEYRVLAIANGHTLVEARPITGRTHQLRVHFAHVGCPITGDDLYGSPSPVIGRHALHAYTLSFLHPASGERIFLKAPIPDDMHTLIQRFFPSFPIIGKELP